MTVQQVLFVVLSIGTLGGALGVVTSRNLFHAGLFLALSFSGVTGYYVLLNAGFLAAVQLMVYVGAIAILILFAIMVSQRVMSARQRASNEQVWAAALVALLLLAVLVAIILQIGPWQNASLGPAPAGTIAEIGQLFLGSYVLPFEVASILLLVALVGAIILAREGE
ncbi:MAG: NADH-quinone oxidoreductase subunit J [Anaerolineae bacterium]